MASAVGPVPEALHALARRGPPSAEADRERLLPEILDEYRSRLRNALGTVEVTVDGRAYPTLLEAIADPGARFESLTLDFSAAAPAGPGWEFLLPMSRVRIASDGGAEMELVNGEPGPPRRAIARVLVREHFPPGAPALRPAPPADGVPTWPDLVAHLRARGIAPLQLALLLYMSGERVRYELDLVSNALLPDRRVGRLPLARRVQRSSRVAHGVDAYVARGTLPLTNARALEVLAETHGLTDVEMAHVLGGIRELGRSALEALKSRQLCHFDARVGLYRPRLETFLPTVERLRHSEASPRSAPLPDPALRTSVSELLAAADARATCPLCGDMLPPGHAGILCANCQAEIGRSG